MLKRCFIISDDLTGGADTGVQFSQRGLRTSLVTSRNIRALDLSKYQGSDVLVVNTASRAMRPEGSFLSVTDALRTYDKKLFPVIYKKIDSTLRGNIGYEIDAILQGTGIETAFIAPSFPQQDRTMVGGIMMVAGKPIALTEMAVDAVSPVKESHVWKIIQAQSLYRVGWVDLTYVSSGGEKLRQAVQREEEKGKRIIIFDAVRTEDLGHIADVAFAMEKTPLLVGSAGLADEIAKRISLPGGSTGRTPEMRGPFRNILFVSGSASRITHAQLERIQRHTAWGCLELTKPLLFDDDGRRAQSRRRLCEMAIEALMQGAAILKVQPERISTTRYQRAPAHLEITDTIGSLVLTILQEAVPVLGVDRMALVIIGGETAMSVLGSLGVEGIEIERELLGGIAMSRIPDGAFAGLTVITKAGAFGREDALERILEIISGSEQ